MDEIIIHEKSKEIEKKLVAFEISEELRQKIRRDAFELGISFSAMLRVILSKYYENKGKDE